MPSLFLGGTSVSHKKTTTESVLYRNKKDSNIRNMLYVLKILSLFFICIPYYQFISGLYIPNDYTYTTGLLLSITTFPFMGAILLLWTALDDRRKRNRNAVWFEIILFFLVFTFAVFINNDSQSNYRFIYIILIITYTIELGPTVGKCLSLCASFLILVSNLLDTNDPGSFEAALATACIFIIIAWTLGYYVTQEKTHITYLTDIANKDGLTGIYNHRHFHERLHDLYNQYQASNSPLSLIMLDVDFFKEYNDIFGHVEGDRLLNKIVEIMKEYTKDTTNLFRYGGDEFCIILEQADSTKAKEIGEQIRAAVNQLKFEDLRYMTECGISISIGIATAAFDADSYIALIDKADSALYRAKYLRRNRVETYGEMWEVLKELFGGFSEDAMKYVKTLMSVIDTRDKYTYSHVERVAHYCELMSDHLHLSLSERRSLVTSAYLHDLGKINISKDILISDQKLTDEQWEELKHHPIGSAEILQKLEVFEDIIPIVKHHHEFYNGTGYPDKLSYKTIPHLARLLSVVDSFDAMTSKRPYQKIKSQSEALRELQRCKGTQFDPYYVDQFVEMMKTT